MALRVITRARDNATIRQLKADIKSYVGLSSSVENAAECPELSEKREVVIAFQGR
jgi:hypothetical protein